MVPFFLLVIMYALNFEVKDGVLKILLAFAVGGLLGGKDSFCPILSSHDNTADKRSDGGSGMSTDCLIGTRYAFMAIKGAFVVWGSDAFLHEIPHAMHPHDHSLPEVATPLVWK